MCLIVVLPMPMVVYFDGCANRFPLSELSEVKIILDPIFKLPKAEIFGG